MQFTFIVENEYVSTKFFWPVLPSIVGSPENVLFKVLCSVKTYLIVYLLEVSPNQSEAIKLTVSSVVYQ